MTEHQDERPPGLDTTYDDVGDWLRYLRVERHDISPSLSVVRVTATFPARGSNPSQSETFDIPAVMASLLGHRLQSLAYECFGKNDRYHPAEEEG